MSETYKPVDFETLRVGDVVHVHWEYGGLSELFLNQEISEVSISTVLAGKWTFRRPACKFYLVSKAKKPLPTELGAVIEHTDGWRFLRVGVDKWVGVGHEEGAGDLFWTDAEVVDYDDGGVDWKEVA